MDVKKPSNQKRNSNRMDESMISGKSKLNGIKMQNTAERSELQDDVS